MTDSTIDRRVNALHERASRSADPVGFMRGKLAEAEDKYADTGDAADLAFVRALEASLDGPQENK